jgi:hypothetical protein
VDIRSGVEIDAISLRKGSRKKSICPSIKIIKRIRRIAEPNLKNL